MTEARVGRIVVGLDGSSHSEAALAWAVRMAKGMNLEVTAVYAIEVPTWYFGFPGYEANEPPPAYVTRMKHEFEELWCRPLQDAGVLYRAVMKEGRPASVLLGVADEVGADVIVVGRRGLGRAAELLLGSVSHELALHSSRAVLLIPAATAG